MGVRGQGSRRGSPWCVPHCPPALGLELPPNPWRRLCSLETQLRDQDLQGWQRWPRHLHPPSLHCPLRVGGVGTHDPSCAYPPTFARRPWAAHTACGQHLNLWAGGGRRWLGRRGRWLGAALLQGAPSEGLRVRWHHPAYTPRKPWSPGCHWLVSVLHPPVCEEKIIFLNCFQVV